MLDQSLVAHCAPTLAGLKTGSLFTVLHLSGEALARQIELWDRRLGAKGVHLAVLRQGKRGTLLYVFRPERLEADLSAPCVVSFLRQHGYEDLTAGGAVERLRQRLAMDGTFPHEIGLFLGYPPEDVEGFCRCKGQNYKLCGRWKVYGDQEAARRYFQRCDRCRDRLCSRLEHQALAELFPRVRRQEKGA